MGVRKCPVGKRVKPRGRGRETGRSAFMSFVFAFVDNIFQAVLGLYYTLTFDVKALVLFGGKTL